MSCDGSGTSGSKADVWKIFKYVSQLDPLTAHRDRQCKIIIGVGFRLCQRKFVLLRDRA